MIFVTMQYNKLYNIQYIESYLDTYMYIYIVMSDTHILYSQRCNDLDTVSWWPFTSGWSRASKFEVSKSGTPHNHLTICWLDLYKFLGFTYFRLMGVKSAKFVRLLMMQVSKILGIELKALDVISMGIDEQFYIYIVYACWMNIDVDKNSTTGFWVQQLQVDPNNISRP